MLKRSTNPKMPFIMPIRPRNLLWLPPVVIVWLASGYYGTPHLLVEYRYTGPYGAPRYRSCDYWGLHPFRVIPIGGVCPLIMMARVSERN